jgi:hypothetical protein
MYGPGTAVDNVIDLNSSDIFEWGAHSKASGQPWLRKTGRGEEFDAELSLGIRLGAYGKDETGLEGWTGGHMEDGVRVEGEDESEEQWTQEPVENDEAEVEACMACEVEPLEESTWNDTEAVAVNVNTTVGAVAAILDKACF